MKKIVSLVLAALLLIAMAIPAFADDTTPSITVKGEEGITYSIYRILDFEKNETTGAFRYKENTTWADFYKEDAFTSLFNESTENGVTYVTIKDDSTDVAAFAQAALAFAKENEISAEGTLTAGKSKEVEFTDIALGYYLVDSSLGALCALDTVNPTQTIEEKNVSPSQDKVIVEEIGDDAEEVEENTAKIGEVVNYKVTINVVAGAQNYVLVDKMEAGLTFNKDVEVAGAENYTIDDEATDDYTFTVTFDNEEIATLAGETIVVTYSATVNKDAEIMTETNDNSSQLKYGDNSATEWDTVQTKVYEFQLVKTDADNVVIDGAEFELYAGYDTEKKEYTGKIDVVAVEGGYRVAATGETAAKVIEAGIPVISGLKGDTTYYLKETKAPAGYNLLSDPIPVSIGSENNVAKIVEKDEVPTYEEGGVQVINQTGTELPSTGGAGTTIFYILGGLLLVGAAVLLMTRKRVGNND